MLNLALETVESVTNHTRLRSCVVHSGCSLSESTSNLNNEIMTSRDVRMNRLV